jgi:hypothetical protein
MGTGMKKIRVCILSFMAGLWLVVGASAIPSFTTLQPGQKREIDQNLQINIVFVGFRPGTGPRDINEEAFRARLPHRYRTLVERPSLYVPSNNEEDQVWNGNSFHYDYNIVYADSQFEDALFTYLPTISIACDVTYYQQYYNTQQTRSLDVNTNSCIEATGAEKWLAENAPNMIGVDTTKYTVFFINWYGRSDFRFHTYLTYGSPDRDPDSGVDYTQFDESQTIGWGGTTPDDAQNGLGSLRRVWFQDLSAGPDYSTTSFALDPSVLLPGTYTIPPVWEYGNLSAYRPFNSLSEDLAKVTRYVALDCLFTTSPIFSPALTPPKLPENIDLDFNFIDGVPGFHGRDHINSARVLAEERALRPYNDFSVSLNDQQFSTGVADAYRCWSASFTGADVSPCYGGSPSYDDLFRYLYAHELQYVNGKPDYQIPIFMFTTVDELWPGFLGIAVDNYRNGTQSFVYLPYLASFSSFRGNSWPTIHEIGHHLGARHPHDGFDYEDFRLFGPNSLPFYFVWAGDDSDTVMSYHQLSNNFSQFDRDNMDRWMTAVYINQANLILTKIAASPRAFQIDDLLTSADTDATSALAKYDTMDYSNAVLSAKSAYKKVLATAGQINIRIEPNGWPEQYKSRKPGVGLIETRSAHQ